MDETSFDCGRNHTHQLAFRRSFFVLIILLCLGLGLLVAYVLIGIGQKKTPYYASTTTGDVVPIEPLSAPVLTQDFIRQWAQTVARAVYSLNFLSYEQQLSHVQFYFTPSGWTAFQKALQTSGFIEKIQQEKLYLSAIINGPAVIVHQENQNGLYTWEVQLPILISFSSSNEQTKQQIYIDMIIKRVPDLETARGIAVTQFAMSNNE